MEVSSNVIFQTEYRDKARKPHTRLQARAPASLDLDQMTFSVPATATANNPPARDTSKAIPLLSPLILSPQAVRDSTKLPCGHDRSNERQEEDKVADKTFNRGSPESWWQHQGAATCTDPSSLFIFFQSQCMIVNPAQ